MITTLKDFILRVASLDDVHDAYYVFEEECSDALRDYIYSLAIPDSSEPFRSAMISIGFDTY
jgi:hypothetical protein